ncbi:MAG: GMP/IMP nucleotidase [Gammaproteobacteria bacterium]
MRHGASDQPRWHLIDTALLDLDGTLLDLAFDNWFWLEHVPSAYAAARGLTPEAARVELAPRFRAHEGTLPWYCIDHWSRELSLDISAMKRAAATRVRWLPGARSWLESLRSTGKRLIVLTNAHPEAFRIKDERTGVSRIVDAIVSAHSLGAPKEDARFWQAVRALEMFEPERSLFVDDSQAVLRAARTAGIRWIYAVRRPGEGAEDPSEFPAVESVSELGF